MEAIDTVLQLDGERLECVVSTLTRHRLGKYLGAAKQDLSHAVRLYVANAKISAAIMTDLHYVEIALRNKFDAELAAQYGGDWFKVTKFLALMDVQMRAQLVQAQRSSTKHWPRDVAIPPGKIIAELPFGFWPRLLAPRLEHSLWTPCLHRAFKPQKAPKRARLKLQLEELRQLRNRVAHHEPIFHLNLPVAHDLIVQVGRLLCPATAGVMETMSTFTGQLSHLCHYESSSVTNVWTASGLTRV
ncbi:Abi family protein [Cupriavidus plantarum]|uniref:Abi family protein n=1 Tax=Cupriavidus plantarum TaxID=942865 RepID=UPI001B1F9320|nr:Abi family protein [Cupriavidus plantarum]CAG2141480.1 hypothetical protein LMG26296_03012 [Cupriavidus plantarum]SMR65308.1 Abi-like protein [Cupriavidus plantarum]